MEKEYDLSDRAVELLIEATKSSVEAGITTRDYNGGFFAYANGKSYGDGTPRENAKNKKAIEDLESNGLIDAKTSEYYLITADGFSHADSLSESEPE